MALEGIPKTSLSPLLPASHILFRKQLCLGPCNQSFNSYCTRKRIIRRCCVLYDGAGIRIPVFSFKNDYIPKSICTTEQRRLSTCVVLFTPTTSSRNKCLVPSDNSSRKSSFDLINYIVFLIVILIFKNVGSFIVIVY